jgi:hypothetical protein
MPELSTAEGGEVSTSRAALYGMMLKEVTLYWTTIQCSKNRFHNYLDARPPKQLFFPLDKGPPGTRLAGRTIRGPCPTRRREVRCSGRLPNWSAMPGRGWR